MKELILFFETMLLFTVSAFAQIEGDVVDKEDKGVPNALIIANDTTGKDVDTVKADERGFYEFKRLPPGKYTIKAKASGFLPAVYKNVEVNTAPAGGNERDDTYYAIRLDISLIRAKVAN